MKQRLYAAFLRTPSFKGKGRLAPIIRNLLFQRRPCRIVHDLRIILDPMEWEQADILRYRVSEPLTTRLFGEILKPGDTYVDVGANIGYHTLVARHYLGPDGTVIAVEPQPYNADRVLENWRCNGFENIMVHVAAAGEEPGFVALPHQLATGRSQLSLNQSEQTPALSFRVPVLCLSTIVDPLNRVKLLKIDVEGFEVAALAGLGEKISAMENIILEILPSALSGDTPSPVLRLLRDKGFVCWRTMSGALWQPGDLLPENNLWATRANHG
jgi:FkbM family methyltransferase